VYFHKEEGKQIVDFREDLLLTREHSPVLARYPSAAPKKVRHLNHICRIGKLNFRQKLRASRITLSFIWKSKPLVRETCESSLKTQ
jgi:hypothetical protein